LTVAEDGEILAVNGPPGTGKTTLLLSVIATEWAKAALEAGEPPMIVAASTNNQAVTNIIDAFGKDLARGRGPFAGRWLPDLNETAHKN
jgi:KaiC/GvpD/RAD55 family RecA-like ATPase